MSVGITTFITPNIWFYGMSPTQRKVYLRDAQARGINLSLCNICGYPAAAPCPVCSNPPKENKLPEGKQSLVAFSTKPGIQIFELGGEKT